MRASKISAFCIALLAAPGVLPGAAVAAGAASGAAPTCAGLSPGPTRTVIRIIDGETVGLDDHSELRLIGALAPRAIDVGAEPRSWPPETVTREALQKLLLNRAVELKFGGEPRDRYGRLQAHAFVVAGDDRRWVQGYLLAHGLARAYALAGNRACTQELLVVEREAREARRGLWAVAAYHVRQARKPSELQAYRSTFQVIEGRVVRVSPVRGVIYLDFSRKWRRGFSASLRRGDTAALLGSAAADPKALQGRRVRVRGWIEGGIRPAMDLSTAGLLEVLDEPVVSGR
jgi:endonuclease YncB( thermonuclease family)